MKHFNYRALSVLSILLVFGTMNPFSNVLGSPTIPNQETLDQIRQEGQFFSLTISKSEPVRIFVFGKEEAKIDFEKMSIKVRRIHPYPAKTLQVDRHTGFFQVNDAKEFLKATDLEISTKVDSKDEVFKIKIKNSKP